MNPTGQIRFVSRSGERVFSSPIEKIVALAPRDVIPCLRRVAAGVAQGCHAAGFLTYEAAPAFDPALQTHAASALPLLWFGLYRTVEYLNPDSQTMGGAFEVGAWTPKVSAKEYRARIERIRDWIAAGDTYQVNYTFPLHADFRGDPLSWFRQLCAAQQADYCAYVNLDPIHLLSASPELFFRLKDNVLETRPMKGTRPRGRWPEEDQRLAQELIASVKDRAENIMIVDLLRNDMSRISESGSVQVHSLYDVETYPTVWQMTSTIRSRTRASVPEIMQALFPSGSVTGAPKIRTMEIIRELEPHPRGVYCGTIGWWAPDGQAEFNVAIRTVTVDVQSGQAVYHVGSGITYGSSATEEYDECLIKASLLTRSNPEFELLETLLYDQTYFLLAEHMERLAASAKYFGFACDRPSLEQALLKAVGSDSPSKLPTPSPSKEGSFISIPLPGRVSDIADPPAGGKGGSSSIALNDISFQSISAGLAPPLKVRLLLRKDGSFLVHKEQVTPTSLLRIGFADRPIDSNDIFLYHKTTARAVYQRALASRPDCDDVLLWNTRGEITESTIANVVLEIDGQRWTPPVTSGLLAGTLRRQLLTQGIISERILTKQDVTRARAIYLINSVRQWINVRWVEHDDPSRMSALASG